MNVIVNTLSVTSDKGGIKTYLTNTLRALLAADEDTRYVLVCGRHNRELVEQMAAGAADRTTVEEVGLGNGAAWRRIWCDQMVIPRVARRFEHAVLFTPSNIASLRTRIPQVVTVQAPLSVKTVRQDVADADKLISRAHRFYYDLFMPRSLRKAQRVVAVSKHLRDKLVELVPSCAEKVSVIHEGVDQELFSSMQDQQGETPRDGGYLLFVSTLFAYKNPAKLLRAFALLRDRRQVDPALRLKLAGRDPWGRELPRLRRLSAELKIDVVTDFLGAVAHRDMPSLYSGALALIYPSAVETFGLPLLEAMGFGVPVVASNRMSVPEVVGDAGLIVDPDDVEAMAGAIYNILEDKDVRTSLVSLGRQRAREFTWRRSAKALWGVLREALADQGKPG